MIPEDVSIETERLLLRPAALEDFDAYAEFSGDADARRYLGGPQPRALAWRSFLQLAGAWHLQRVSMFSMLLRENNAWVGYVGPWCPEGWPGTEVGWGVLPKYWGKGYATEGAVAAMDWAFENLGWDEIIHTIDPRNVASVAVARKLGAIHRGPGKLPAPYENAPVEIWGQTREQWFARGRDAS